ncbi:MAG TPA: Hsp20/alpha crystallin family protein [Albitalea sp.]
MARLDQVRQGLEHALESLAEGWRELSQRATGALTRFKPAPAGTAGEGAAPADDDLPMLSGWAFLAADVFEDDDKVVVRLEAPGMRREDFHVEIDGDVLTVRGEKRFERETGSGRYRVVQCAYGHFRREVGLPVHVQVDKTRASYRDGVLRIELPKAEGAKSHRIDVHEA